MKSLGIKDLLLPLMLLVLLSSSACGMHRGRCCAEAKSTCPFAKECKYSKECPHAKGNSEGTNSEGTNSEGTMGNTEAPSKGACGQESCGKKDGSCPMS